MDQRWRTGRLSGTRREREGFNPCYLAHRGFRARWTLYPVHIINARLEFPWKRHVGTMRFHVSSICATTLLFREGRGEREWGEHIYIYTWWWPPFVSLIVSATALFLSSLVTSATGFARSVKTRHIVRKAYGPRGSSYFSGTLSPFFSPRGSRIVNRPDSTAFLRSSFCFSSRYMYIYNAVVNRRRCNWRRDVIYITLSVIGSSPDFFLDRVYDIFLDDSYYNL